MRNKLNKKELQEPLATTIGRLQVAIKWNERDRALELLKKINDDTFTLQMRQITEGII